MSNGSVSYRGLTGVVAWMVKNALGVIPAQAGIRKIIVILNLFQDLFQEMLKQVQHDKKRLDSRLRGNDTLFMAIFDPCNNAGLTTVQLNSERFRQDEFNGEPAERTGVREHRRI
nr:palindromic element RPE3 domain-containing protein [Rickettsia endosymbiont of Ceutorhynchus assimilis]